MIVAEPVCEHDKNLTSKFIAEKFPLDLLFFEKKLINKKWS